MFDLITDTNENINEQNFSLSHYRIYKPVIVYTGGQKILIHCNDTGISYCAEQDSLILLTKSNYSYNITSIKYGGARDLKIKYIDEHVVKSFSAVNFSSNVITKNIFIIKPDSCSLDVIYDVFSKKEMSLFQYFLVLSYFGDDETIMKSLMGFSQRSLTDRVIKMIEYDLSKNLTIMDVSKNLFVSESCLRKRLKKNNLTFKKINLDTKMRHASIQLRTTSNSIYVIADSLGFASVSYFIKVFKDYYGITPKKYKQCF
ncbi:helix-turn-helix transcriptional regulator [Escherichia coli]|uniref:helix-turn-helix transcriptional regulator n=1 Tax=Escherichia coli TaxID=562 RepID=UPI001F15F4ED|nr:helix-turn-helix transcriptional regulator [Escherichia coli]MCF7447226.1 helix-turn-helix transcriptional regulator [Escherichia coli]MEC9995999.1 helix-turn-helix transcriptional regulator [Escherichia coli]